MPKKLSRYYFKKSGKFNDRSPERPGLHIRTSNPKEKFHMKLTMIAILLALLLPLAAGLTGCETTSDIELRRAEKALNDALAVGADANATDDYQKAEELLIRAQELARDNKILESRQTAVEAKVIADDAKRKSEERMRILEEEADRLGK